MVGGRYRKLDGKYQASGRGRVGERKQRIAKENREYKREIENRRGKQRLEKDGEATRKILVLKVDKKDKLDQARGSEKLREWRDKQQIQCESKENRENKIKY